MKKRQPIIALAQIEYDPRKKSYIDKIIKYIKEAKRKKADIVCFPESCICRTKTLHFDDELIKQVKKECAENSIWCILTEDIILRGKPYNLSILIDRKGKIKGSYKKIHLYGDTEELNAGKKTRVFQTDFAKIGIVICWDLAFPELFKKMKKAGAEIVFCPAEWAYEEKAHDAHHKKREKKILESLILARAFENLYFVALGNPVRKYEKEQVSYSAIASPHKILKEIVNKEGLITAKLNMNEIKKFEKLYNQPN